MMMMKICLSPIDNVALVEIVECECDLGCVEPHSVLRKPTALSLQILKKLATSLVVHHEIYTSTSYTYNQPHIIERQGET
jgi:hypothetical protein